MTTSATAIDLSTITGPLINLAGTVLIGVASWAIAKIAQAVGLGSQKVLKDALVDATVRAITWAEDQVGQRIAQGVSIDVRNAIVASAANYLLTRMPDTLKSIGLTPATIEGWVTAHLPPPTATA